MTGGGGTGERGPGPIDDALADVARALEALRGLLHPGAGGGARGDAAAGIEEILAIAPAELEPSEVFTLVADRVRRVLAADQVVLFAAEGGRLSPRSSRGFRRNDLESVVVEPGHGIVGRAFAEGQVTAARPGEAIGADRLADRAGAVQALAVPVRADDGVAGVLYAARRASSPPFAADDVVLLQVAADRIAGAFTSRARSEHRRATIARLVDLASMPAALARGRDATEILSRASEAACRVLGVSAAAVALGVEDLQWVVAHGVALGSARVPIAARRTSLTAEVHARGAPVACRDLQARREDAPSFLVEAGLRGCLVVPLSVGAGLGVLYLADAEARDFSAEDVAIARVVAAIAASAVESARGGVASASAAAGAWEAARVESETTRALAELAGGIAREFSQIFAAVLGRSQLLLARGPDDAVREGLAVIEEAAWRGADIVRLVGALAPGDEDAAGATDVRALAQDAVALVRALWSETEPVSRRIEIATDLQSVPPVRGAEGPLRDAIGQLVQNALDAMPEGGQLAIRVRPRDGGVELVVEDTGPGLDAVARARMFEPFFTTRGPSRLGLGLTLVRSTVARWGGRVEVVARPDRGVTATLWLPAAPLPRASTSSPGTHASPTAEPAAPLPSAPAPAPELARLAHLSGPLAGAGPAAPLIASAGRPPAGVSRSRVSSPPSSAPPTAPVEVVGSGSATAPPMAHALGDRGLAGAPLAEGGTSTPTSDSPPSGVPPASRGAAPPRAPEVARAPAQPAPLPRGPVGSVLVLEDETSSRALLVDALAGAGHDVRWAAGGLAGLAEIEGASFDVVLVDLALPERSGLAIARAAKRASPRTRVVLVTGWGHLLDRERLREHGVDLLLLKPVTAERAVSVVGEALRLARAAAAEAGGAP